MKKFIFLIGMCLLVGTLFAAIPGFALAEDMPGTVSGEGTHFEIIDSEYLNITVDTTVAVNMYLTSVPEWISYNITTDYTDISTTLTIGGLAPSTTYYLYEDGENSYTQITTDASGQVSYVQDLSAPHIAYIFQTPQDMTPPQMPGEVKGEGTHFAVTDSDYLNVTVDSVEPVSMRLSSISNTVTMDIAPITAATSTQLTIGSLLPGTTYYKYEDDLHNGAAITTDAVGSYTYTQDLTTSHHVMILTHHSTKFIKDDATGGDCTSIGIWDAATKTCTLTTDLTETIQIDSDGITLDGNGHSLVGSGEGFGVYASRLFGITIKNMNIRNFTYGIHMTDVFNSQAGNVVENNNISDAAWAIIWHNASHGRIENNYITNISNGIKMYYSVLVIIKGNLVTGREDSITPYGTGIYLHNGSGDVIENITTGLFHGLLFSRPNGSYDGRSEAVIADHNLTENNHIGIRVTSNWGWSRLSYNIIRNNTIGYHAYSDLFKIMNNNFIDNTQQLDLYNGYYNWSNYFYNYWSDFDTPEEGCTDGGYGRCSATYYFGTGYGYRDISSRVFPVQGAGPPLPPTANAGPDQTVECVDYSATMVTLDGSGSFDPNGDALTYSWSPFDPSATGVSPTVSVPYGSSNVTLTVDDGNGATASDSTVITVSDTTAPSTTAMFSGTPGENGWFVSDVAVTLDSTGGCSGVAELHYSINGVEQPVVYGSTATFTITEDGEHTVSYWAVDNSGKAAQVVFTQVNKETVSPVTTATSTGTLGEIGGEPTGYFTSCVGVVLTPSSVSGAAAVEYSQDGGQTWSLYTVPLDICIEGLTTWLYRTRSAAGHLEDANTLNLYVDLTPPTTTHEIIAGTMGENNWYVSDVTIELTSVDATSGVAELHYKIDGVAQPVVYGGTTTSPLKTTFTITGDGAHTVTYWAIDDAGRAGQEATTGLSIETSPPVTDPVVQPPPPPPPSDPPPPPPPGDPPPSDPPPSDPPPPYYPSCVTVQLVTASTSSGVLHTEYSDNGGLTWQVYNGSFEVCDDGATVITYRSTSSAGNVEDAKSFEINIDQTNPVIAASVNPAANASGWNNSDVVVSFDCTDAMSSIASCTAPITITAEGTGQVVTGTAVDMGSNSATTTVTVNIDRTLPAISASVMPAPNASGWHSGDVVVSFDCTDALSGMASCTAPITVTADGAGQVVTGEAVDVAGNTATTSVTVNMDKTAPTISASVTPEPNANGWNNTDATVTFTCDDATSYIAECTNPISLTTMGAGQVVTGKAVDAAGYSATTSVTVNIDKTAPTISASVIPAPNASGWHSGDVVVSFDCTDALSGVASCTAPITITADGAGQVVTGEVVDVAGNTATTTVTLNIDRTLPAISASVIPAPNGSGWHSGDVVVSFDCTDALSGVASCTAPITITAEGAGQVVTGEAVDVAGNTTTTTVTLNIDRTLPAISASVSPDANGSGWHNSDVTVTFTCTDATSGIASCEDPITVTSEGAGQVVTGTAVDAAGNSASTSVTLDIDKTAPAITITGVSEGTKYPACSPPTPAYEATDSLSGLSSSNAALTGGNANGVGEFSYEVTASDIAGNNSVGTVTYKVIYTFEGFQNPVTLDRPFKLGSTIPVKFRLNDGCGNLVPDATATLSLQVLSGAEPSGDPIDGSSNVPDSGNIFRYVTEDGHYIYNLSTDILSVGTWLATVTLDDTEAHTINIGIK